ncbi:hypothetical protein W02_15560 [Nitrospira sp. KM1]|uniref:hypothetical protein n=1 Tax=Nitrospira sp. KM1 TaxID=1936990 RepID=UPI0013A7793F|nr:hypothetical protein [Nitrospira sp. KM1]BCA54416.1 hypothetical protein W02_15560 [Nitrospira sp. KM1]
MAEIRRTRNNRGTRAWLLLIAVMMPVSITELRAADPPCDIYPPDKQARCATIWRSLNQEDGPSIAQFGLDQQKRRDEGKITAEQHLSENMRFIKQSTEKRLERLRQRMTKE